MFELLTDSEIGRHDTRLSPECYDITGLLQAQCQKDAQALLDHRGKDFSDDDTEVIMQVVMSSTEYAQLKAIAEGRE